MDNVGHSTQQRPLARPQIVDRETSSEQRRAKYRASGESERVVSSVRKHAAVEIAVLLLEILADVQFYRGCAVAERDQAGAQQHAEWLLGEAALGGVEIHLRHPHFTSEVRMTAGR
jgi:hypothetical protein